MAFIGGQLAGFLNIDCGKEEGYSSSNGNGLVYTSDPQYVSTGEIHNVSPEYQKGFTHGAYLRSFPDGVRNCFNLPLRPGQKYLPWAYFHYGNYDGRNQLPQFARYAGVNYWQSVAITNASGYLSMELVLVDSSKDYMDLCLVNTGGRTPFISLLELRPLPDGIYPQANASQALMLMARNDIGGTSQIRAATRR